MNRTVWIHRAAAVATIGLAGMTLASVVSIYDDLQAVAAARDRTPSVRLAAKSSASWASGRPLLRRNGANAQIAVGEYLNSRLGEFGLAVVSAETATPRPLGGGLHLAEVRVQARGDAAAVAAMANWVAVNREAVRLKSLNLGLGADEQGTAALVLLLVIA